MWVIKITEYSMRYHIITLLLMLTFPVLTQAQQEAEKFNINTELYTYYQRCLEQILRPVVLSMSDSLYNMAEAKDDKRMQAVALSTKLDYFYYEGEQEDSIVFYTKKVKNFAKQTNQPKYYYFAWSNRLIFYYIKTARNNIALYEAEKMLKEAKTENNKIGLLNCYNTLANIYSIKGFRELAIDWFLKETDLTENKGVENYNISTIYTQLADFYAEMGEKQKMFDVLIKAKKTSFSINHIALTSLSYVKYHLIFGNIKEAWKELKNCQILFRSNSRLNFLKKNLFQTEYFYYKKTGQYDKALIALDNRTKEETRLNEHEVNISRFKEKGELYGLMGNYKAAMSHMQEYITIQDSLKIKNEQRSTGEFATLLNMEKLNSEKKELILQSQKKEIRSKTTLIISLIVLLVILFIFLYRENLLNRKLRISESKLKDKNEELTISREELKYAKEKAETASQMKTNFIQNMSHEIRTPLNSIVGFSQVLSDKFSESDPETKEFAEIIHTNSNDLLRLVTDVLTLSELDKFEELPSNINTDVNMCCQLGIETAKANKQENVKLVFEPAKESIIIQSNPERLSQLLINLMHNAAKFTNNGSIKLAYTISEENKIIEFSVTDTGIGIPKDKHKGVFERFTKLNSFTQGTGLGLPICISIVEKLHGSIYIDKEYQEGCRFIFTIPYKNTI